MSTSQSRISVAAIALGFAIVGALVSSNFVFSGNATLYAQFVQARTRDWLITAGFASVSLVVCMPVLWRGRGWHRLLAIAFILLAALILVASYGALAS